jgi:hypothetical protein
MQHMQIMQTQLVPLRRGSESDKLSRGWIKNRVQAVQRVQIMQITNNDQRTTNNENAMQSMQMMQ